MEHTGRKLWYSRGMSFQRRWMKSLSYAPALAAIALSSLVGASAGCERSSAAEGDESAAKELATQADESAAQAAPQAAGKPAGRPSYEEDAFVLRLEGPKQGKVGETVELTVELLPQGGYKVNEEYPIKFQFADLDGATAIQGTVSKSEGKVDAKKATLPLKVKLDKAGTRRVGGKLSFSVCTDERCLIEKRDLEVPLDAS